MAERILSGLIGNVLETLGSLALSSISYSRGVHDELEKLKNTVSATRAAVLEAEKRQTSNEQLRDWLGKLKDALYDADDVLDEFQIEAWRKETESITRKVRKFFSRSNQFAFPLKMAPKIKKVRERFDEIAKEVNQFNLTSGPEDRSVFYFRETHSFEDPSDVIGRDNDRDNIIDLLTQGSDGEHVSVIPIVGLGGLGKTTLAKLVYNNERILEQFNLRMWVCISGEFDLKKVIRSILKLAEVDPVYVREDSQELEILQSQLRDVLHDRKYFLVLDDVWNEDRDKWKELERLLRCAASGSKILVTTRSDTVASIMTTSIASTYKLTGLPAEACLALFLKLAFGTGQEMNQPPSLVEIGWEIVEKCKGFPLAVKTLGNLLYMKSDPRDWIDVRNNEIWKLDQKEGDFLPVLQLSYDHLPSRLKQCFAYCSIFPKGHIFLTTELIFMWSSQGLLGSLEDSENWQNTGEEYIKQLGSVGFFQEFEECGLHLTFKMHDLVHDLALKVGKPECLVIDSQDVQCNDLKRVRHLSFCFEDVNVLRDLLEMKHLRTIYCPSWFWDGKSFLKICISRFIVLRMLDLHKLGIEVLPSSISKLKHLRHLDLSGNYKMKSIPNSICKLVSLETLWLEGCEGLKRLPKSLGKLIRLRNLSITTKEQCLPDKEIRCLTSLQDLVISGCPNIRCIISNEGMQRLVALRTFVIRNCESLVSLPASGLRSLPKFETLVISNCEMLDLNNGDDDVLQSVEEEEGTWSQGRGFSCLQRLWIVRMPKLVALPSWILPVSLRHITIAECKNITELMAEGSMENLRALERLQIMDCPRLISLPENMGCLASLRKIWIENCGELTKRCERETGEEWPKIARVPSIYISDGKPNTFYFPGGEIYFPGV